jgi:hypothetical protein
MAIKSQEWPFIPLETSHISTLDLLDFFQVLGFKGGLQRSHVAPSFLQQLFLA